MNPTAVDTSVVVAALLTWHEFHRPARAGLTQALDEGLVIPAPVVAESYSVMTRLPASHRLAPADAHALLSGSFENRAAVVGLTEKETWRFLRSTAERGIAGGAAYDALILACARKARARRLLTFDRRGLSRLDAGSVEIVVLC